MRIIDKYNLINNNTFGLDVLCDKFIEYDNDNDIVDLLRKESNILNDRLLVLGQGSNILFVKDFMGSIIHPITKDIKILKQDREYLYIQASAGVIWDEFVEYTLLNNAYGLENLSLIPGTVGASAVQNIGAYAVEVGDFIHSVKFLNLQNLEIYELKAKDCKFNYRNSIFKNELSSKTIILSVVYRLYKHEKILADYLDLRNYPFESPNVTPFMIREAVINIRGCKLPDPMLIGNAGSFFKNPIVDNNKLDKILIKFPDIKYYKLPQNMFKLAAGWMIDKCGFKSFSHKGAGVHENQALVLINKNNASGKDIQELSEIIKTEILNKFDVLLEPEVLFV